MHSYDSVWDAIEDDPAERAALKAASATLGAINAHIRRHQWDDGEAGAQLGITRGRARQLREGAVDDFTLDELMRMAGMLGINIAVTAD